MGGAVFPPCSLVWGCPVLESVVSMVGYRGIGITTPLSWVPRIGLVCAFQESLFPQFCRHSIMKSCCPSKSVSLGISSSFARPPGWEVCCGARTFTTDWGLFLYNCLPVCGSSPGWLHGGANGYLLQQNLCHVPCLPVLPLPVPLSLRRATADPHLHRRPSNTHSRSGPVSCGAHCFFSWVLVHTRFGLCPPRASGG